MKRSPNYILKEMQGHYYLIPFGQASADFSKDVEINEEGAFIWKLLENDMEASEVVDACMKEYECPPEQYDKVKAVVETFFDQMFEGRLLEWTIKRKPLRGDIMRKYVIAGLNVHVTGSPDIDLSPLDDYIAKRTRPADTLTVNMVRLTKEEIARHESIEPGETLIIKNEAAEIYKGSYGYRLEIKDCHNVVRILINEKGDYANIEYIEGDAAEMSQELFLAIRLPFTYFAALHGLIAIHSASIVYRGKGWLFSGRAMVGKSTHTNLWKKNAGVTVFNGDMNLLGAEDSLTYMYGVPWCGESGISEPGKYPVAGITFLKQSSDNRVSEVKGNERVLKILRRLFSPLWNHELLGNYAFFAQNIAETVCLCQLECTADKGAFEVMKTFIDEQVL
ncbi:MAG: PqqD family protein [Lachnospiraceae bacterium]|nr:PqqD family protein [Lachnospiraceae bacterium]